MCQNWGDDPDMECDGTPRPNGEGLCVAASGTKNGKRIIAEKCKAGSSKQQWQIGPM